MKIFGAILLVFVSSVHAEDSRLSPDYKTLYLKANEAAAAWKAQALDMEERAKVAEGRLKVYAAEKNGVLVNKKLEEIKAKAVQDEKIAEAQRRGIFYLSGKVISVTDGGVIFMCAEEPDPTLTKAVYKAGYKEQRGLCFIELDNKGMTDDQMLTMQGLRVGEYVYKAASGGTRTVPKYIAKEGTQNFYIPYYPGRKD